MIALDVRLDQLDQLGVAFRADDLAALAVDDLAHDPPPSLGEGAIVAPRAWGYLGETLETEAGTRIQLCGRLVVELAGRRIEGDLPGRQGRLLFAYLVATRSRRSTRSELVAVLWPQGAPDAAESSLASLLSKLRRVLGPDLLDGKSELRLVLPTDAWIDLEAAGVAVHRAESAVALGDWAQAWALRAPPSMSRTGGFSPASRDRGSTSVAGGWRTCACALSSAPERPA